MEILTRIQQATNVGHKMLTLLVDPEKMPLSARQSPDSRPTVDRGSIEGRSRVDRESIGGRPWVDRGSTVGLDFVFLGGSTGRLTDEQVLHLRARYGVPVVLFPGNAEQLSAEADALLFLSLLSGREPETLVGQQIAVARRVEALGIETIPMGYILLDGGTCTSTMRVTHSQPIDQQEITRIVDTALAAQLMGKQLVYLEAGSGAVQPVRPEVIRAVREAIRIPLIVGGGIRSVEAMQQAWEAGADMVVIGNYLEQHPEQLEAFCHERR